MTDSIDKFDSITDLLAAIDDCAVVPVFASDGLLASMALRYRHDFGILSADEQRTIMAIMRQIHEEVVGKGFYSVKDEDKFKRALNYGAMDELSKIDQELGLYDES